MNALRSLGLLYTTAGDISAPINDAFAKLLTAPWRRFRQTFLIFRGFRFFLRLFACSLKLLDAFGRVRTRSDAFRRVRMHLDAYGCVRTFFFPHFFDLLLKPQFLGRFFISYLSDCRQPNVDFIIDEYLWMTIMEEKRFKVFWQRKVKTKKSKVRKLGWGHQIWV